MRKFHRRCNFYDYIGIVLIAIGFILIIAFIPVWIWVCILGFILVFIGFLLLEVTLVVHFYVIKLPKVLSKVVKLFMRKNNFN